jgi:hypothetical protein
MYYTTTSDDHIIITINKHEISTLCRPDTTDDPPEPSRCLYCLPIRTYRVTTGTVTMQRLGCLILIPTGINHGEFRRWAQVTLENELDQEAVHKARVTYESDFLDGDLTAGKFLMTVK